jgi:hypothetical protein
MLSAWSEWVQYVQDGTGLGDELVWPGGVRINDLDYIFRSIAPLLSIMCHRHSHGSLCCLCQKLNRAGLDDAARERGLTLPIRDGSGELIGVDFRLDISCPIKKNKFRIIAQPSTAIVDSGTSTAPQFGVMIRSPGSTNSGEVTVNAANVHTLATAVDQRRTFIFRSTRMRKGCTRKKAPHTKKIPHRPIAINARRTWATALAKNATNNPKAIPRRANGAKRSGRKTNAEAATFQRLIQNSLTDVDRIGDLINEGAVIPVRFVRKS